MQAYRSSNKAPVSGLLMLLVSILVGGVIIGALVYGIAHFFYLIVLFPIIMGALGGIVVASAMSRGKIRNPLIGVVGGLLIGCVIYGSYNYLDYREFRSEARAAVAEELEGEEQADTAKLDEMVDFVLAMETSSTGFIGYVKLQAQEGVSIGRVGRGNALNLGSTFTWIYWAVELAMIAGFAAITGRQAGKRPFCETHETWFDKPAHLGGVNETEAPTLLSALQAGNYAAIGQMLSVQTSVPSAEVYFERCAKCEQNGGRLSVERIFLNNKGKAEKKQLAQGMISGMSQVELLQATHTQAAPVVA